MQFLKVFLRIQTKYLSHSLKTEATTGSVLEEKKSLKKTNTVMTWEMVIF